MENRYKTTSEEFTTMEGWLRKKSNSFLMSSWKWRYCCIRGSVLSMYDTRNIEMATPKDKISIVKVEKHSGNQLCIIIHTHNAKPLYLLAEDRHDFNSWFNTLSASSFSSRRQGKFPCNSYVTGLPSTSHGSSGCLSATNSSTANSFKDEPRGHGDEGALTGYTASMSSATSVTSTTSHSSNHQNCYLFVATVGTTIGIPRSTIDQARIELDKLCLEKGEEEPDRGNLSDTSISWRVGKPDYTVANLAYFQGKSQEHKKNSLEKIVEDLVKKWEMEASHKQDFSQWETVHQSKYWVQANGGKIYKGLESVNLGNYNWLLSGCPRALYDAESHNFESSHDVFRGAFPNGFPWEVLEVYSGPPRVSFSWRHWAHFTGKYKNNQGSGELVNMIGFIIATLEGTRIVSLEVFYKPDEFLEALEGIKPAKCQRNQMFHTQSNAESVNAEDAKSAKKCKEKKECQGKKECQEEKK